jgi:hypothetical protein
MRVMLVALLLTAASAAAQPSFVARRIETERAPRIDGDLSDEVWSTATPIGTFHQVEPLEGAPPSEQTVATVLYDENYLYVGVQADDTDPALIVASGMGRDAAIRDDDHVMLILDPVGSQRDGYAFGLNPLGSRWDALIENNARTTETWDTIWRGSARVNAEGWSAEFAIPFRSISWSATRDRWGFQIVRVIQRKKEQIRWSSVSQSIPTENVSRVGTMDGIRDIRRGRGFDAQGFVTAGWRSDIGSDETEFEPGANLYYRFTPSLTGTVTVNTDFSDTPLDERRVNTGRFALFFPETRDFFLQDAAVFEFGGLPLSADPNGMPFFSRQIGIAGTEVLDLDYGGKLSGRAGRTSVGVLSARTGEETLSVARASFDILGESRAGVIVTHGDPLGVDRNVVAGADFQYRRSDLFGDRTVQADGYYVRSDSRLRGDDDSWGVELAYPNDRHYWNVNAREVGADYVPALGFVNRPGIRSYNGNYRFRVRPDQGRLRWWQVMSWNELVTDLEGAIETRVNGSTFWIRTNSGDEAFIEGWQVFEKLIEGFDLPRGVHVREGEYTYNRVNGAIRSSRSRRIAFSVGGSCCDFYEGTSRTASASIFLRPSRHFGLDLTHRTEDIELPTGSVTINIDSIAGSVNFTPEMRLALQAQYDNISERLAMSARWRWEIVPGSEVLIALAQNVIHADGRSRDRATEASVRFAHTLRY